MYKNLYILLGGCLACLLVFIATFGGSARDRADFVFNNTTEPQTLDPGVMSGQPEGAISVGLHEGLTTYHPRTLEPMPGVATSWEVQGLEYTFHLREDSWWIHGGEIFTVDGRPRRVVAQDFIDSWRRMLHPETGSEYSFVLHFIEGIEAYEREVADHYRATIEKFNRAHPEIEVLGPESLQGQEHAGALEAFLKELREFRDARFRELVGLEAPDPQTLVVRLRSVAPFFLDLTSFYPMCPVPREVVEKYGKFWTQPDKIVTNGPYYLEEWRFNSYIRLRKNPHYWETEAHARERLEVLEARPADSLSRMERDELDYLRDSGSFLTRGFETIDVRAVEEQITSLNLYINGDIDRIRELPTSIQGELHDWMDRTGEPITHLHTGVYNAVYYYAIYTPLPVFQSGEGGELGRKLRRALALSINREGLTRVVTRGGQPPAYRLVPPGVPGYSGLPAFGSGDYEQDLARARELVAEVRAAGVQVPKLKILYNTHEAHQKVAVYIQDIWKNQLGIEVELTNQEWGVYLDSRRTGNFEICRAGWIGDYRDPNTFLDLWVKGNQNNDAKYDNPHYDRIVKRYCASPLDHLETAEKRQALLADVRSWPAYDRAVLPQMRPDGAELDASLEATLTRFASTPEDQKLDVAFQVRLLLFEVAEQMLLWDMPTIPLYHYTTNQLWPPELEGCHINSRDIHPLKTMRWKGGEHPGGTRYHVFPRLSSTPSR